MAEARTAKHEQPPRHIKMLQVPKGRIPNRGAPNSPKWVLLKYPWSENEHVLHT